MSKSNLAQAPRPDEWRSWLMEDHDPRFVLCDKTIELAETIAMAGWRERAQERGLASPEDLSGCCKFSSLFVKFLFGGCIEGHYDHQFNVIEDQEFDLNDSAKDVREMSHPHWHDDGFIGSHDHVESMKSCLPRVLGWLDSFAAAVPKDYVLAQ